MSAFDYSRSVATADRLIARLGQAGLVSRAGAPTGPAYDPTPGADVDYPATFVVLDYQSRDIDGTRILATDKMVYLKAGGLSIEPTTSDLLVEGDGSIYKVVDVKPLKPASTVVFYQLQVRR